MVNRLMGTVAWPYRFLLGAAGKAGSWLTEPTMEQSAHWGHSVELARSCSAAAWRKLVRWTAVLLGLLVFASLQIWVARQISDLRWWFVLGFLMVGVSAAVAIARPIWALIGWIIASPIVSKLFNLDWGTGLPAITFDRSVFYFLALSLFVRSLVRRDRPGKLRVGEWLLLAFPLYVLVTGPLLPSASVTSFVLMFMRRAGDVVIIYFLAKACVTESKHAVWILATLVAAGFYCAAMGFYDHFTGKMSIVALVGVTANLIWSDVGGRAAGPFLNPALQGMFLGITVFLALHCASWMRSKGRKLLCYAAVSAMLVSWYWTYTRGGYLLLLTCLLLMPFLTNRSRRRYLALVIIGASAVAVVLPVAVTNPAVRYRLTNDRTAKSRLIAGAALINTVKHHPWIGVGLGNGNTEMINYVTSVGDVHGLLIWETLGSWNQRFMLGEHTTSHSTYLTVLADHGLIGGVMFIGLFAAFIVHLWRARIHLPASGILGRELAGLVVAIAVGHAVSINTLRVEGHEYVNYVLWILIAVVLRLEDLSEEEPSVKPNDLAADELLPFAGRGSSYGV